MAIEPVYTVGQAYDELHNPIPEYEELPDGEDLVIEVEEGGTDIDIEAMENVSGETVGPEFNDNLAEHMSDTDLKSLASNLIQSIDYDLSSRKEWADGLKRGLEFLGTNYEERTEPFRGSSGVVHPLLAESIVQFQAHAYSEVFPSGGPARTQVVGKQTSETMQQAERVKNFINYEITEDIEDFEEEQDDCLFNLPLDGSAFKKIYWDNFFQRPASKFVRAEDIIVPYTSKSIETSTRVTHRTTMSVSNMNANIHAGFYSDADLSDPSPENRTATDEARDKVQGTSPSMERDEYTLYEVHTFLDIEGFEDTDQDGEKTGIHLSYIVTIEVDSGKILSIYRNYREDDPLRKKIHYFVSYKFLPGLGFYGFGLTHMIGNLSRAATGILRQLIDAGTFSNLPGGFKAKGLRTTDEDEPIRPGEWRDIDVPGGNLREGVIPLPYKEPSATLFQLMGYLVEAGQRFHSVNLEKVADSNQQAPVGTTMALIEHGMRVMSGVHKRLHRSQKKELRILARIISENYSQYPYEIEGLDSNILVDDFSGRVDILPISDPNIFSTTQRIAMAQTQLQMVSSDPEMHGPKGRYEAYRRMYAAIGVQDITSILPPIEEEKPKDPAIETAEALTGEPMNAFRDQDHDTHVDAHIATMSLPSATSNPIIQMAIESHILEHFSLKSQEIAESEFEEKMKSIQQMAPELQDAAAKEFDLAMRNKVSELTKSLIDGYAQMRKEATGQQPDPNQQLVEIRKQEIALQAQKMQMDAKNTESKINADRDRASSAEILGYKKIESSDRATQSRENVAREKIESQEGIADERNRTSIESTILRQQGG